MYYLLRQKFIVEVSGWVALLGAHLQLIPQDQAAPIMRHHQWGWDREEREQGESRGIITAKPVIGV